MPNTVVVITKGSDVATRPMYVEAFPTCTHNLCFEQIIIIIIIKIYKIKKIIKIPEIILKSSNFTPLKFSIVSAPCNFVTHLCVLEVCFGIINGSTFSLPTCCSFKSFSPLDGR